MFCKKCGKELDENQKFCPECGTPCVEQNESIISEKTAIVQEPKKKKKSIFKKWWFWVIVIICIGFGCSATQGEGEKENQNVETEKEVIQEDDTSDEEIQESDEKIEKNENTKADMYMALGDNEVMPYTMSEKAYMFVTENEILFPADSKEKIEPFVDYGLEYKIIAKNTDNYGDKLLYLPEVYVLDIGETNIDENNVFTELQVSDVNGNNYYVMYFGALDEIYEEDIVTVYGLPLSMTFFGNQGGGTTEAIMLAGSFVEKVQ